MLPHVIRFNGEEYAELYQQLVQPTGVASQLPGNGSSVDELAEFITQLVEAAGLQTGLQGCGVLREHIPELAEAASRQWTAKFNPRTVDVSSLSKIYENAY
jgi:alcohol dehydrogenase